jgi:hypothetical protein
MCPRTLTGLVVVGQPGARGLIRAAERPGGRLAGPGGRESTPLPAPLPQAQQPQLQTPPDRWEADHRKRLVIRCIPMADNATPAASPTTSNSPVSRKIIDITALCCAPRALRMPISLCAAPLHTKGLHRGLGPGIFFTGARYESPRPINSVRSGNVFYNTPSRRAVKRHCQTLRRQGGSIPP